MNKPLMSALLLPVGIWFNAICVAAGAPTEGPSSNPPRVEQVVVMGPKLIALRRDASELESFAANEVRRYVYLRTGKVLPVKKGVTSSDRIVVACKNTRFCGGLGPDLGPQQFTLRTGMAGGGPGWGVDREE